MDGLTDDALEQLFDEARHVVQAQRESLSVLDNRLSSLLRFEAVLLGGFVTVISVLWRSGAWQQMLWVSRVAGLVSIGFLLGSILTVVISFRGGDLSVGLRAEPLATALDYEADRRRVLMLSLHSYSRGIASNGKILEQAARGLDVALWTLVLSLVSLSSASIVLWGITSP